jgi:hypothetical protein
LCVDQREVVCVDEREVLSVDKGTGLHFGRDFLDNVHLPLV